MRPVFSPLVIPHIADTTDIPYLWHVQFPNSYTVIIERVIGGWNVLIRVHCIDQINGFGAKYLIDSEEAQAMHKEVQRKFDTYNLDNDTLNDVLHYVMNRPAVGPFFYYQRNWIRRQPS